MAFSALNDEEIDAYTRAAAEARDAIYTKSRKIYVGKDLSMTNNPASNPSFYLFGSRFLTHAAFWLAYYLLFSLIWARPDSGYFASFYLEFVLMPVRILAAYGMIYLLIPNYLQRRQYRRFVFSYVGMISLAGLLQLLFGHFFFDRLLFEEAARFPLEFAALLRSIVLINTTALLLGALKVFQLYMRLLEEPDTQDSKPVEVPDFVEVKSNRRQHRLHIEDILYIESMGNYVNYHLRNGDKMTVYASLKSTQAGLPDHFLRLHRSFLVNARHIRDYSQEDVSVGSAVLPRGKEVDDQTLQACLSR